MHPKLLLADDSVTIQRVIELTFADEDVQVTAVGDGQQAIDRVRVDRPDIVLADVGMPERDGYEVSAFIKGDPSLSHIPVLLLTGAFEPIDEARAKAVGCDGVLVKPFEPQMVINRVRDLLAGKRTASATAAPAASQTSEPAEPAPSLEDYFDRLDAALASKSASPPPPFDPAEEPVAALAPATVQHARFEAAAAKPVAGPAFPRRVADPAQAPPPSIAASGPVNLEQAFAALFAAEQGQPVPAAAPATAPTAPVAISDALVDAVVAKVIARMGDESMRTAVLDAAERLVREEIDRIKSAR